MPSSKRGRGVAEGSEEVGGKPAWQRWALGAHDADACGIEPARG